MLKGVIALAVFLKTCTGGQGCPENCMFCFNHRCMYCRDGFYGDKCTKQCNTRCESRRCLDSKTCELGCSVKFYGKACENRCSDCPSGRCDVKVGVLQCALPTLCSLGDCGPGCEHTCKNTQSVNTINEDVWEWPWSTDYTVLSAFLVSGMVFTFCFMCVKLYRKKLYPEHVNTMVEHYSHRPEQGGLNTINSSPLTHAQEHNVGDSPVPTTFPLSYVTFPSSTVPTLLTYDEVLTYDEQGPPPYKECIAPPPAYDTLFN